MSTQICTVVLRDSEQSVANQYHSAIVVGPASRTLYTTRAALRENKMAIDGALGSSGAGSIDLYKHMDKNVAIMQLV